MNSSRNNEYLLVVRATSGTGARQQTADQTVLVTVTDVQEPPAAPAAPSVTAVSDTSLRVAWVEPANTGPRITGYQVRYRTSAPQGDWTEKRYSAGSRQETITRLAGDTAYDVQVRAANDEGDGDWSPPAAARTNANALPVFTAGSAAFEVRENGTFVGSLQASDPDSADSVTGSAIVGGADAAAFRLQGGRVLRFNEKPNFEAPTDALGTSPASAAGDNRYVLVVRATSGTGARERFADLDIVVTVTDSGGELPDAPAPPEVAAASATSLRVTWSPPANSGPPITDYDYRYRAAGQWIEVTDTTVPGSSATIAGLTADTSYSVQVRATNADGTSGWSFSSDGARTSANAAPAFSDMAVAFIVPENRTAVGTVVATDSDGDDVVTGYAIADGADGSSFSIGESTGVLAFQSAPDYEAPADANGDNWYVVVMRATSGTGDRKQTADRTVLVRVTDVGRPHAPGAPSVAPASVTSLTVSWSAPVTPGPPITDYDYRYRVKGATASWTEATATAITATSATITGLTEGRDYEVQVRATSGEGTSDWSLAGSGDRPANQPATGQPTISGTAQVGQDLTASVSGISDGNGLTSPTYSYQWLRGETASAAGEDISGARSATYTVVEADQSKYLRVRVSFQDDDGNPETVTSDARGSVAAEPNESATGQPTISGTAQVGQDLSASVSGISDGNGLTSPTYSYQWLRADTAAGTGSEIAGGTSATYTVVEADQGKCLRVRVSFQDDDGNAETATSDATGPVAAEPNESATGQPTISGTARVGENLTASVSGISDGNGLTTVSYSYQWLRGETAAAAGSEISGATSATYTVVEADQGKYVRVQVSFQDDDGNAETATSDATGPVVAEPNESATGQPTISGTAQVGGELTAGTSGISDGNGLTTASYSYQWLRANTAAGTGSEIAGGTSATYTVVEADQSKYLRVQVSFQDDDGNTETVTSDATGPVSAEANAPATGQPTISGKAQVGENLSADTSGISDGNGLTSPTYSYQWLRAETADAAGEDISAATSATYTVVEADQSKYLRVRVSFQDDDGNDETATSDATGPVRAAAEGSPEVVPPQVTLVLAPATIVEQDDAATGTVNEARAVVTATVLPASSASFVVTVTAAAVTPATAADFTLSGSTLSFAAAATESTGAVVIAAVDDGTDEADWEITVTGTAPAGVTAPAPVTLTIRDDDPEPVLSSAAANAEEGDDVAFKVTLSAASGKQVTVVYAAAAGPGDTAADFTAAAGTLTFASGQTSHVVPVATVDDTIHEHAETFTLTLSEATNATFTGGAATLTATGTIIEDNTAPGASNRTVTMAEDTAYRFGAADFGFTDPDPGDALASVRVVTLPGRGALALAGATANANQVLPAAELGNLTFTPGVDGNGAPYASFRFKVSDGEAESASAYTMTLAVTAVNDPPAAATGVSDQAATAAVAFSYQVPADAFSDVDGDALSYRAARDGGSALPPSLSFEPATRTFTGRRARPTPAR